MRSKLFAFALISLSVATFSPVDAATVSWSFVGPQSGSGSMVIDDTEALGFPGGHAMTSITGSWDGVGIAFPGFLCHGVCTDNIVYPAGPIFLDGMGIAFNTVAGHTVGIYHDGAIYRAIDCGSSCTEPLPGVFALPTPVPAALPLFATGLGVLALLSRRRKKPSPPALHA